MSAPLQKTKLFIPPARARLVERPRLLERLDELRGAGSRAALISAPAGSGKTVLLAQWLAALGWPVGWLSLDERDNQPPRFFAYLVAALQNAVPGAGKEAQLLFDLPGVNAEEIITLLANDLAEAPGPFLLVLDDTHTIRSAQLHQALDLLLEAQPPQMRLVLLSREDPPIALARRRARGQLVELRQEDLRFTQAEALDFVNQCMGLELSAAQVETLEGRTEGWIAGLQLAALSLQHAPDVDQFIRDFSGSHRFILDYLMEEVLAGQPAETQAFLLQTSVLERMSAELCAAVSDRTTAEARGLLERAARANLFVIPLDADRRWYRYHHLFRDLLRSRLRVDDPARGAGLELRASAWYEAGGDPRTAVEYALQAGDVRRAADLVERHIAARWQTVDLEFHQLINHIPAEIVRERPGLCLQEAWLAILFGQVERVLPLVEAAERQLAAPERPAETSAAAYSAFARTLRAYLADLDNQPVRLDPALDLAYRSIPETNPGMRNSVGVILGTICFMETDFAHARRYYEEAIALDLRVNGTNAVPIASMRIALMLQTQGRLREAERVLQRAEQIIQQRGPRQFYISGAINLLLGSLYLEWNRGAEAAAQLETGLHLLEDWPSPAIRGMGQALSARLHLAGGEMEPAREILERAFALLRGPRIHPSFRDMLECARLELLLAGGDRAALKAWAEKWEDSLPPELSFRHEARRLLLCRAWLSLGREREAAELLQRLADAARERAGSRIAILVLLTGALGGASAQAQAALAEALRLGEAEGYLRVFLTGGPGLQDGLRVWLQSADARAHPQLREYGQRILQACGGPAPSSPISRSRDWIEPLSAREQEVLALVASGMTNPQIAAKLVISVRTVKKHVENIHGKLGVENRTQAAARARDLGLLP